MLAATLFVPSVSIFSGFKNYLKSNLKLPWILNFIWVIDISSWLSSVQFFPAALPVMEIKLRLVYRVVKNLGVHRSVR